jgi:trimeric autotransporter adhesin
MTKARNLADNALTTVSPTELGYLDGVTSAVQTQLNARVTSVSGTTGRVTSSGGATPAIDLNTSGVTAGSYGTASAIPAITVDTYGRVTSATTNAFSAGGMTLISSGSIGTGFTVSSIPGTYNELVFIFSNLYRTSTYNSLLLQFNGSTSNDYNWLRADQGTTTINQGTNTGGMCANYGTNPSTGVCRIPGYATSGGGKIWHWNSTNVNNTGASAGLGSGIKYNTTAAITSITILADSSTVGSYQLFGVK